MRFFYENYENYEISNIFYITYTIYYSKTIILGNKL